MPVAAAPAEIRLPQKPRYKEACNGCGLCCALELCPVAEVAFPGAQAPCPALKIAPAGNSTYCELVMIERLSGMEPLLQRGLGIGLGCSMEDEDVDHGTVSPHVAPADA